MGLPNVSLLRLDRLDRQDTRALVEQVTVGRQLPDEMMWQIIERTDGIPLFVEELTKMVLESGLLVADAGRYRLDSPFPSLAIPATLQDSLMARLDRLAPVKEVAQIGAAIGRDFSYTLLRSVAGRDDLTLSAALAQLEQAELLMRRGTPPEARYSFKHALVQEAAYESLLKSRRLLAPQAYWRCPAGTAFRSSPKPSRKCWPTTSLKRGSARWPSAGGARPASRR